MNERQLLTAAELLARRRGRDEQLMIEARGRALVAELDDDCVTRCRCGAWRIIGARCSTCTRIVQR